jgi:arabinan endo-1,5-alpha-L-arabinosidase
MTRHAWPSLCVLAQLVFLAAGARTTEYSVSAGEFVHVYNPGLWERQPPQGSGDWTWYVNDHTFVYGPKSEWHIFGITHTDPADPECETNFAHAVSQPNVSVNHPHPTVRNGTGFQRAPFALGALPPETHLWAPYVLRYRQTYYMFYCAGGDNRLMSRISLATSDDLWNWRRVGVLFEGGVDGRDPMVLDRGESMEGKGRFIIYYTGTDPDTLANNITHCHYARMSDDLLHWGPPTISFRCDRDGHNWGGPCESPFVIQRGPRSYYLFTGIWFGQYSRTHVFHSSDPTDFGSYMDGTAVLSGIIHSHAAEVIRDSKGDWWVSRCGWGQLGVYVAPLNFSEPQGAEADTYPHTPAHLPSIPSKFDTNVDVDQGFLTYLPTTGAPLSGDDLNGTSVFVTSSGLALGNALNASYFVAPVQHTNGCNSTIQIVTKDGNAVCESSDKGRFNTTVQLIPFLVPGQGTYIGVEVRVNSFQDSTTTPQFEMRIVTQTVFGEGLQYSTPRRLPFGDLSVPFHVRFHLDSTSNTATATAFPSQPYKTFWPGANGISVSLVLTVRQEYLEIANSSTFVALSVNQGSVLVSDLVCN